MPAIRPFRALRYDPEVVGDMAAVVSPPYDLVGTATHQALLARDARNIVRADLPLEEPGEEPEARYRRAARTLAGWRAEGVLHRDRRPSFYAYEQCYRGTGGEEERVLRGFFGRLRLEPYGPESTVLPTERTLPGPSEDRYRLLRASGSNVSPIVGVYGDGAGASGALLEQVAARSPDMEVAQDAVRHRLWVIPDVDHDPGSGGPVDPDAGVVAALSTAVGGGPVTIVDGHHRYAAALRYRDERRSLMLDGDEPFDYVLALLFADDQTLTVAALQRVLCGIEPAGLDMILAGLPELFSVRAAGRDELLQRFAPLGGDQVASPRARGSLGLWGPRGGSLLEARMEAIAPLLPPGGRAFHGLDATLLQSVLERLVEPAARDGAAVRSDHATTAAEAIARVDDQGDDAVAAFLLEPTPVADILAVANDGDLLPARSGYLDPAVPSGLVVNPHEW